MQKANGACHLNVLTRHLFQADLRWIFHIPAGQCGWQWHRPHEKWFLCHLESRDATKLAFEFNNVRTSNVFSRFEIRHTRLRIQTSGLHDRHHMFTPTGHRNNQLNKCALPNSLKGPKIILDMAAVSYTHLTLPTNREV